MLEPGGVAGSDDEPGGVAGPGDEPGGNAPSPGSGELTPPRRGRAVSLRRATVSLGRTTGGRRSSRANSKVSVGDLTELFEKLKNRRVPDGMFRRERINRVVERVVVHIS